MFGNNENESLETDKNGIAILKKKHLLFEDPEMLYISHYHYRGIQIYYEEFEKLFKNTNQATVTLTAIPRPKISTSKLLNRKEIEELVQKNYPRAEYKAGIGASVDVKIRINDKGNVTEVDIRRSGGRKFDAVAKAIAYKMKYSPMVVDGEATGSLTIHSIVFKPNKK